MAIGQLLITYPARHTLTYPLSNPYLHAAVAAGIVIQLGAAWLPFTARVLGNARLPVELWALVFGVALLSWGFTEGVAQFTWRNLREEPLVGR